MTALEEAAHVIRNGGIVAYPTESVYGLGCDPKNRPAVEKLCRIKQRETGKGFILIGSCFEQLAFFCAPIPNACREKTAASWPGPFTWLFPPSPSCPAWLHGDYPTLAVRVTAHPTAAGLCKACNSALISTSANLSGQPPVHTVQEVRGIFQNQLDFVVDGETGRHAPTPIRDAVSGKLMRP